MSRWRVRILGMLLILPALILVISMGAVLTVARMQSNPLPEPEQVGDHHVLVVSHEIHFHINWLILGPAIFLALVGVAWVVISFFGTRRDSATSAEGQGPPA